MAEAKIFAGPRIRRIRNRNGLSQTAMAGELGISPSYLNLIERNQRPLTVQVLLKLATTYDIDIGALQGEAGGEVMERLGEVFSDPLLAGELPSPAELVDFAESAPNAVSGLIRLYGAYRETTDRLSDLSGAMSRGQTAAPPPRARTAYGDVAGYFEQADPWVADIENAGARIGAELRPRDDMFGAIKARLRALHSVDLRVLPAHALPTDRARFDRHSHRIFLSESLIHEEKTRLAAIELALLGEAALLDMVVATAGFGTPEAERLARLVFAAKLAGAILMPAPRFLRAAGELRYDIAQLARRFGVAVDRVMERLATARDPEGDPVEFGFLALDASGNIETRIPGAGFLTPRFGALCARLPVFDPIAAGRVISAQVDTSDRTPLVFVATVTECFAPADGGPPPRRLAALVMSAEAAAATVYAPADGGAGVPLRPIGTTCRLCERRTCPARTMPAATRPAALNEYALGMSDYDPA